MFEHHIKAGDLPDILKVKSYEQRIILKELYHVQQEMRKNHHWLESYKMDPVPHLSGVADKITAQLEKLGQDENNAIHRLDDEARSQLRKLTGSNKY